MFHPGDEPAPGYRLLELLGRGRFGEVWRATAPGRTSVALKLIDLSGKHGAKEFRAVERVKEIRHVNLIPITALWIIDQHGEPFDEQSLAKYTPSKNAEAEQIRGTIRPAQPRPFTLVVAMLLGDKSLADRLKECRSQGLHGIPVDELLGHMEDAARGIDFLNSPRHDLGEGPIAIQHCDIKPENIMLVGDAAAVCDFGLARVLGDSGTTSTMAGSPAYMAPEVIDGRRPSHATDQYSLAVSYYELRAGVLPFEDQSYDAVLYAHLRGKLDFAQLPPSERDVIVRATSLDPQDRFATTVEMVRALRRAVDSGGESSASGAGPSLAVAALTAEPEEPQVVSEVSTLEHDDNSVGAKSRATDRLEASDTVVTRSARPSWSNSLGRFLLRRRSVLSLGVIVMMIAAVWITASSLPENDEDAQPVEMATAEESEKGTSDQDEPVNDSHVDSASEPATDPPSTDSSANVTTTTAEKPTEVAKNENPEEEASNQPDPVDESQVDPASEPATDPPSTDSSANVTTTASEKPTDAATAGKLEGGTDAAMAIPSKEAFDPAEPSPLPDEITHDIGMKLKLIPAGEFMMGSPESDEYRDDDEGPVHRVRITKPYYLAAHEVTQGQWKELMGTSPWKGKPYVKEGPDYPATYVSWRDAEAFCRELSEREGREYRLPTEAEWEYACRAGSETAYCFGDDSSDLGLYAWYKGNTGDIGENYPHQVRQKRANVWGLYDMHGNVYEWCQDWYDTNYFGNSPADDPVGPPSGSSRAYRGGSWYFSAGRSRSANRNGYSPGGGTFNLGFRVALVASETEKPPATESHGSPIGSEEFTNSIGMKLKLIPAGEFMMGSPESDKYRGNGEGPVHRVRITKPYYLAAHEVTQSQWEQLMGTSPWKEKAHVKEGPNYPATFVSWEDAVAFCGKLSEQDGRTYRLPKEAEWEYACRAGTKTAYCFGDDSSDLSLHAWHKDNTGGIGEDYAHTVGQKRENAWGLYDMHGNVWEWCQDWYDEDYYGHSRVEDPTGPSLGSSRVIRGGSWHYNAEFCRAANRGKNPPDGRINNLGFRVALDAPE